ncbi:MAG: DUF3800 domain-containing protein [Nitrosotalea sp.]
MDNILNRILPIIVFFTHDKTSNVSEKEFNEYCEGKIKSLAYPRKFVGDIQASIRHLDSKSTACLQVADYVAGSISTKFTRGKSQYYDVVKTKLRHKKKWDWYNKINW